MLCLSGLVMDVFIRELASSVSELLSAANQLKRVVVQALLAVVAHCLRVEGWVDPYHTICGSVPSADTRCVGGVFSGKVRRRGHLYHQLKDLLGLLHVIGMFNLGVSFWQGPVFHCKAMDAREGIRRREDVLHRRYSDRALWIKALSTVVLRGPSVVRFTVGLRASCDFVRSVLLKSRQCSCAVWCTTIAESTETR